MAFLKIPVPSAVLRELEQAAIEATCPPTIYAGQIVEVWFASRRLPNVPAGKCGARVPGQTAKPEGSDWDELTVDAGPVEPPMLDDLDCLADIL